MSTTEFYTAARSPNNKTQVLIKLYKSLVRVTRNIIMEGFKLFMHTNKTQRTDYRLLKIWIIQRFA